MFAAPTSAVMNLEYGRIRWKQKHNRICFFPLSHEKTAYLECYRCWMTDAKMNTFDDKAEGWAL